MQFGVLEGKIYFRDYTKEAENRTTSLFTREINKTFAIRKSGFLERVSECRLEWWKSANITSRK